MKRDNSVSLQALVGDEHHGLGWSRRKDQTAFVYLWTIANREGEAAVKQEKVLIEWPLPDEQIGQRLAEFELLRTVCAHGKFVENGKYGRRFEAERVEPVAADADWQAVVKALKKPVIYTDRILGQMKFVKKYAWFESKGAIWWNARVKAYLRAVTLEEAKAIGAHVLRIRGRAAEFDAKARELIGKSELPPKLKDGLNVKSITFSADGGFEYGFGGTAAGGKGDLVVVRVDGDGTMRLAGSEPAKNGVAAEQTKPSSSELEGDEASFQHPLLGELVYADEFKWFEGEATWLGVEVEVHVHAADAAEAAKMAEPATGVWNDAARLDKKARKHISDDLFEVAEDGADEEISPKQFQAALKIESIAFKAKGVVEFLYDDGGMLGGHGIFLRMDAKGKFEKPEMFG